MFNTGVTLSKLTLTVFNAFQEYYGVAFLALAAGIVATHVITHHPRHGRILTTLSYINLPWSHPQEQKHRPAIQQPSPAAAGSASKENESNS